AARLAADPQGDDDEAERIGDQRLKVANRGIGENIILVPCGQPFLYDLQVKRLLLSHYLPAFRATQCCAVFFASRMPNSRWAPVNIFGIDRCCRARLRQPSRGKRNIEICCLEEFRSVTRAIGVVMLLAGLLPLIAVGFGLWVWAQHMFAHTG